jgi:hypothetical protein
VTQALTHTNVILFLFNLRFILRIFILTPKINSSMLKFPHNHSNFFLSCSFFSFQNFWPQIWIRRWNFFCLLLQCASNNFHSVASVGGSTFCRRFRGFKLWILDRLNLQHLKKPNCRNHFKNDMETEGSISDSSHVPDGMVV